MEENQNKLNNVYPSDKSKLRQIKKVSCMGGGYVGGPTMAVFASKNPDIQFVVYDVDNAQIAKWVGSSTDLPVKEPGLDKLIESTLGRNLSFTNSLEACFSDTDVILIAVNTPLKLKQDEHNKDYIYDMQRVEECARMISTYYSDKPLSKTIIVVEKSTVPVGTHVEILEIIAANQQKFIQNREFFTILSNPEFLSEDKYYVIFFCFNYLTIKSHCTYYFSLFYCPVNSRSAIKDLLNPDRVVIGGGNSPQDRISAEMYSQLFPWVPSDRLFLTDTASSELAKLVANAFLAQRISSINSISALCEQVGADIEQVRRCIGSDSRIGNKYLQCSVGFGGSCLTKEILGLASICKKNGLINISQYWQSVVDLNENQKHRFSSLIVSEKLYNNVKDKILTVFGLTFKKDTNDLRNSPAITVCHDLLLEGAKLQVFDPNVAGISYLKSEMQIQNIWKDYFSERISFCSNGLAASKDSHAIVILTDWEEFKSFDYSEMFKFMKRPSFIFDGRNLLQREKIESIGFAYFCIGQKKQKE